MIMPAAISLHGFESALIAVCGAIVMVVAMLVWVIWKSGRDSKGGRR